MIGHAALDEAGGVAPLIDLLPCAGVPSSWPFAPRGGFALPKALLRCLETAPLAHRIRIRGAEVVISGGENRDFGTAIRARVANSDGLRANHGHGHAALYSRATGFGRWSASTSPPLAPGFLPLAAADGEPAGTTGLARREAVDVQVLPQGQVPRGYDAGRAACVNG